MIVIVRRRMGWNRESVGVKARGCEQTQMQHAIHMHTCLHVAGLCSRDERTCRHSICLHRVVMIVIAATKREVAVRCTGDAKVFRR